MRWNVKMQELTTSTNEEMAVTINEAYNQLLG